MTKVLIRLRVCTGWSAPLLFSSNKVMVSRVEAHIMLMKPRLPGLSLASTVQGSIFFWTYSSCGASGLNFSLVLTPVELVLKSGILKVLMSSNQHYAAQVGYRRIP